MRAFLREYWLWILIPVAAVSVAILVLVWLGRGEQGNPFAYPVF